MSSSSRGRSDLLAIGYQTNFIGLLRIDDIFEKKNNDRGNSNEVEIEYIDYGYHLGKTMEETESRFHTLTMDMDLAVQRPLLATCSKTDSTLRIWNYMTFQCEMVKCLTLQHTSRPAEPVKPLSIAFHPSGYILAGGFSSQAIIWHLLLDDLRQFYVFTHYKHCTKLKFSHGGQYLAIAQMLQTQKCVYVHNAYTLKKICTIKIPSSAIICDIVFNDDDTLIALCCTDGFLILYNMLDQSESSHSKRKCVYTTCCIKKPDYIIGFGANENKLGVIRWICKEDMIKTYDTCDPKIMYAQFFNEDYLVAGTENGLIKYYQYPGDKPYGEINTHAGPVSKILIASNNRYAFSCGEDGVIFVYNIYSRGEKGQLEDVRSEEISTISLAESLAGVVLVEKEKMRAEQKNLEELSIKVRELENDMKARAKQSEVQWTEHVKELEIDKKKALAELEARVNSLKDELSKKEQQHTETMKKLETNHIASVADLEAIFKAKVDRERKNYMNLEQNMKETVSVLKDELEKKEKEKDKELLDEHFRYKKDLERLNRKIKEVKESQSKAEQRFEDKLTLQEEEHGQEMDLRETELNKEINNLKNDIKSKDEAFNKLDTQYKELEDKNKELSQAIKNLKDEIEELQVKKKELQNEAEKAHKDMITSIAEMNDLKGNIIGLKSKNKDGMKDRQALADLAKNLREKMAPVIELNNDYKEKIKQIEAQYNASIKNMEKAKEILQTQESAIVQLREEGKKRSLLMKRCEERVEQIARRLYEFNEKKNFDRNAYGELFSKLYKEYVDKEEAKFKKNPEIVGELGRQIQHLQDKKTTLEKSSKDNFDVLSKACSFLRNENAKLIYDLNDTRRRLQEMTMRKFSFESKLKAAGILNTRIDQVMTERKGSPGRPPHIASARTICTSEEKRTMQRPLTTKQRKSYTNYSYWWKID